MASAKSKELKFVVMGSTAVGKSAITIRFVQGHFVEQYDPTIEDCYTKDIEQDGINYKIEILDTAGVEMFAAMRELYMKNGQGFVLVYSITSEMSFEDLIQLHDTVLHFKNTTNVPIVLVGNKSDLSDTERVISREKGKSMAASWNCPFLETSAKLNENISNIFSELIREVNRIDKMVSVNTQKLTDRDDGRNRQHKKSIKCPKCTIS